MDRDLSVPRLTQEDLQHMPAVEIARHAAAMYRTLQIRCDRIEERALARFRRNSTWAKYMLKTASEYWLYRELCSTRDYWENEARTHSQLAMALGQGAIFDGIRAR